LIAGSLCMGLAHNIPVFMIGKSFKHAQDFISSY
jgi:hypothetical protein